MSGRSAVDEIFKAFYLTNRPKIIRMVLAYSNDTHLAEDIAQDTMMVLRRTWGRYDRPEILMYRVARQQLIKRTRRIPAQFEVLHDRMEDAEYLTSAIRDDDAVQIAERVDLVRALKELPTRQREVIVLAIICDLGPAEAALVLGISESAVKTHKLRGIKRLQEILQGPLAPVEPGAEQQLGGIL